MIHGVGTPLTQAAVKEYVGNSMERVGSLGAVPIAQIIRRVTGEGKSGDLQVIFGKTIKTLYFDRGFIVFAASNLKADRLGESLIEFGRISRHEFAMASMLMKTSKRKFGQVLVDSGLMSEEELGRQVALVVNKIALSLFKESEGIYSFDERPCIIPMNLMVSLSVYRILLEGVRRMSSGKLILAGLPPLTTTVRVSEQPPFTFDFDNLKPVEQAVLRAAGKGATIESIVKRVKADRGRVLRACYGLVTAGVVEPLAVDGAVARPLRVQEETGVFLLSDIERKFAKVRAETTQQEVLLEFDRLNQAGDAEILRVGRHTTVEELKGAFETRRREWSTKRAILENEPSLVKKVDEIQARLEAAFQRMSSQQEPIVQPAPRRSAPDEKWIMESPTEPEVARRGSVRAVPAAAGDVPLVTKANDPVAATSGKSAEPPSRRRDPRPAAEPPARSEPPSERRPAASIQEPNPIFDPFANEAEPRAHATPHEESSAQPPGREPDFQLEPLSAPPPLLKPKTKAPAAEEESPESTQPPTVFLPAADGEELLDEVGIQLDANPPSTAEYSQPADEVEATAAATVDDIDRLPRATLEGLSKEQKYEKTKQLYRDVQLHFQVRDYEGAISLLYELIKLSPKNATYHGLLAKAMLKHPVMRKNAERHFVEALRLDPENADLHYSLGVYYKAFGFHSRAITQFRTALRIDPSHEKAKKGLSADVKKDSIKDMFRKIFG